MPKSSRLDELQKNYEDLEIRLIKARAAAKNLKKFQEQYKEAQVKFRLALQLLPDTKEIPSLLESISKAGQDSGLEFILFQPSAEVSRDFYAEIPVKIQVKGGYHSLAIFFDKVGKLPRIVNMFDIKITTPKTKGTQGYLDASCVAMTYRFLEASEMKASKAKKKKKKKKRG